MFADLLLQASYNAKPDETTIMIETNTVAELSQQLSNVSGTIRDSIAKIDHENKGTTN